MNDDVNDGQKSSFAVKCDVNNDVSIKWCKRWCKWWTKLNFSIFHKCKDGSFNPCKEWCKFLKFTWKFTAFTKFVEKTGDS